MRVLLVVLSVVSLGHAYQMRYISVSSFSSAYENEETNAEMNEISGLCSVPGSQFTNDESSEEQMILYGIGDFLVANKPVWKLQHSLDVMDNDTIVSEATLTAETTLTLADDTDAGIEGDGLDSEGIAYLKRTDDTEYILISSEAHRTYSALNRLLMYSRDISDDSNPFELVTELDQNTTVFRVDEDSEVGTRNNGGLEALDSLCDTIDSTECTVVYASESPVYQDLDTCDLCIRISVNTLDMSNMADPKLTQTHQLLYEMDQSGSDYEWVGLVDIAYIGDGTNNALLMERAVASNNVNMRVRIYLADLSMQSDSDVSDCFSLDENDQCEAKVPLNKTLVFDVLSDEDIADDSSFTGVSSTNFEALTRSVILNREHGGRFFVAASDNGEVFNTRYMTLELTQDYFEDESDDSEQDDDSEENKSHFISVSYCLILSCSMLLMMMMLVI